MTIRVLVVEDSDTVRGHLVELLDGQSGIHVVGEAADGKRAIELCETLRPDVITLDMVLPEMSGLAVTEYVMAYHPTAIVIVSSSTNRGELFKTYDALAAGAVDVLEKPRGDGRDELWQRQLVDLVKVASRIKVITHPRARLRTLGGRPAAQPTSIALPSLRQRCRLIAIGASTGGPAALLEILGALSPQFPIPILIVIHISEAFASCFAEWLDNQSPLRVAYARAGEPLPQFGEGRVILAPPGQHLVIEHGRLRLTAAPERHSCRPSVDVLFESVAQELGGQAAACLLTGMGRDGAAGLLAVAGAGGVTLAQDEATSVVFGMPREAILLGAARRVLPLGQFASALTALGKGS